MNSLMAEYHSIKFLIDFLNVCGELKEAALVVIVAVMEVELLNLHFTTSCLIVAHKNTNKSVECDVVIILNSSKKSGTEKEKQSVTLYLELQ